MGPCSSLRRAGLGTVISPVLVVFCTIQNLVESFKLKLPRQAVKGDKRISCWGKKPSCWRLAMKSVCDLCVCVGPYLHVLADDGEWPRVPRPLVFLRPSLQSSVAESLKGRGRCSIQNRVGPAKTRKMLALGLLHALRLEQGHFCSLQEQVVIICVRIITLLF